VVSYAHIIALPVNACLVPGQYVIIVFVCLMKTPVLSSANCPDASNQISALCSSKFPHSYLLFS
jgi:hypothetical protein